VATLETVAPPKTQRHHDISHLSPDGRRRRRNAQSLKSCHHMKLGDAGRSRAVPKSHPACVTPEEAPVWVRISTFLFIQPRILTWLTPKAETPEEERQDNNPAAHVRWRHGPPFSSPQWWRRTQNKRKDKGKIEQKCGQAARDLPVANPAKICGGQRTK
jgi:hypothetical protein